MMAAHEALLASAHFRRRGGRDHLFVSSGFRHPTDLFTRMAPLSRALRCSMAGRYKSFGA
jgi:hypothetical protein